MSAHEQAGIHFTAAAASDVGLVREGNEDSFFAGTTVFAVADGMGGHVAGEIASSKALEPIEELDGDAFDSAEGAQSALVDAITAANTEVIAEGDADPSLSGMGTTLTAVLLREGKLHLAHVGDSRAYLLRSGERISQLTTDHTLVEQLVREGRISREQAAIHPQRSVITRAIGVDREVEVDSFPPLELEAGDQVLLCSDGLTGPVDDARISQILDEVDDGDEACAALIQAAKDGGAPDNVTVVLLRMAGERRPAPPGDDDERSTGPLPVQAGKGAPVRTSEGATPINTRSEPDPSASWAERMGRYGERQGAESAPAPSRRRSGSGYGGDRGGRGGRGRRGLVAGLVVLVLLALAAGGGYALLARSYFVGDDDGQVAVFNGVPQTVVGVPLFWVRETSDLATDDLPPLQARRVGEGVTASSLTDARETIERYRETAAQEAEEDEAAEPSPTPSPEATPTPDAAATP